MTTTTVLVTGCDRGIGHEFVRQYAADGAHVIAVGLAPDAPSIEGAWPGDVEYRQLDVTDHAAIERLATALSGRPIDITIHNAGIGRPHPPFGKTDYALWRRMLEVNLLSPLKITEALLENVVASNMKTIAFISSRMGSIALNNSGGSYAYRSSKAGLNMVVKSLAVDLAPRGVCVLSLHPGRVPSAALPLERSVSEMRDVIARSGPHQTGAYLTHNDQLLPW
jgi:NAD(P)-dependent dehydrogenase (short-subunit alcohol dehydrogenase family)